MNAHNGCELEKTDLGEICNSWIRAWICGRLSARCISMLIQEKLDASSRMTSTNAKCDESVEILGLITGDNIPTIRHSIRLFDELFKNGPEVLFLKAKSVLIGSATFSGISSISISQVNSSFRRLSLEGRCINMGSDSPGISPNHHSVDLRHLHVYMEIIRAYMQLYKSPNERISSSDSSLSNSGNRIQSEFSINSEPSTPEDVDVIISINNCMDEYLIRLMRIKTRSMKLLSKYQRDRLYEFLGVTPDVSDAVLKRAYRQKAMEVHPDKGGSKEMFQQLNEIYETILQQRGLSCTVQEADPIMEPSESTIIPSSSPSPRVETKISEPPQKNDSTVKLLKLASACVSSAKLVTEKASEIVESSCPPDQLVLDQFLKHARDVGYACLNASSAFNPNQASSNLSAAGFDVLNSVNELIDQQDSTERLKLVGETTKKCVACAQLVSQIVQSQDIGGVQQFIPPKISRHEEKRLKVVQQRKENVQLLRKLNRELVDQHHDLIGLINTTCLQEALDTIEWFKLAAIDHVNDCLVEMRDVMKLKGSGESIVDVFVSLCQLFDPLYIPSTPIGRACRLVYILNPAFVTGRLLDIAVSGLLKHANIHGESTEGLKQQLRDRFLGGMNDIEPIEMSNVSSRRSSTRNSPIIKPIEFSDPSQFHFSRITQI